MSWFLASLKKYAVFRGRARRKEYWWFVVFNGLFSAVFAGIEAAAGISPEGEPSYLYLLYALGMLIPGLAVSVRRLHDTNRTGWWLLAGYVPLIGQILLLFFLLQAGDTVENRYGPDPKEDERNPLLSL